MSKLLVIANYYTLYKHYIYMYTNYLMLEHTTCIHVHVLLFKRILLKYEMFLLISKLTQD